jgi:hypothetical protein
MEEWVDPSVHRQKLVRLERKAAAITFLRGGYGGFRGTGRCPLLGRERGYSGPLKKRLPASVTSRVPAMNCLARDGPELEVIGFSGRFEIISNP